jgi:hypothetical protein|nr:MAG TPA: hypothetical protein [Caudoviricetes sp.]
MPYYVYDEFGDGCATVSEELPQEFDTFIGEYSTEYDASMEAVEYENYIQDNIDKLEERLSYDEVYDEED